MLKLHHYDEEKKTDYMWIDSSSLYYTKMVEDPNENKGDLYVTFKTGATYKYKDVKYEDYVLLVAGGTDFSQGKTLNKLIKSKYECEKIENGPTIQQIDEGYIKLTNPNAREETKRYQFEWNLPKQTPDNEVTEKPNSESKDII